MWLLSNLIIFVTLQASLGIENSESKDKSNHECVRSCADQSLSKKLCRYEFFVHELLSKISNHNDSKTADESTINNAIISSRYFLGINGNSPGPPIEVCLGDTIEVLLYNRLGSEELSFHWHGLRQKLFPHMDGVPMVTQCSILPYGGFRYKLKPDDVGTYIYYAHLVSQQANGVYGSLTVRGPRDDPSLERILLLSSRPPTPLSPYSHLHPPTPSELLLNGQNTETIVSVKHGETYLLRLINVNAYNCPILLSISGHEFRVSTTDGNAVDPETARHIVSFPGERFDIIVEANQPPGKYLIYVKGLQDCRNLRQEAFLLYENTTPQTAVIQDEELLKINSDAIANKGHDCRQISKDLICSLDLKGSERDEIDADHVVYVPFDVHAFSSFNDGMSDYRYNVYGCPFYPSHLSINKEETKVAQINGMSFKYPTSPLLSQPENTPDEAICSVDSRSSQCDDSPHFCECIQVIEVPSSRNIDIILIDQGFHANVSYTFHIHGYNASILGRNSFDWSITKDDIVRLDKYRQLHRNYVNPPQKDTFVVPNKGYVILRLFTDNLGYWLWEARSTGVSPEISGPIMQFLLKVGSHESFLPVPLNFPTCGNNKLPDMVFETH